MHGRIEFRVVFLVMVNDNVIPPFHLDWITLSQAEWGDLVRTERRSLCGRDEGKGEVIRVFKRNGQQI